MAEAITRDLGELSLMLSAGRVVGEVISCEREFDDVAAVLGETQSRLAFDANLV